MLKEIHSFFELFDIFWGGVVTKIYILYFRREFVIAIFLARNASFMLDSYLHHIASGGMSHGYDSPRDCHVLFVCFVFQNTDNIYTSYNRFFSLQFSNSNISIKSFQLKISN